MLCFYLQCNGSADKGNTEQHFKAWHETCENDFPSKTPLHATKSLELKALLAESARQSIFVKPQGKATTPASYRACHVLGKHNEPFKDSNNLEESFLEAANSFFENFNNKT